MYLGSRGRETGWFGEYAVKQGKKGGKRDLRRKWKNERCQETGF